MNIEIIEEPIRFHLHGISGVVENERYAEVGLRLMDTMWRAVKGAKIPTTGINHWVYLPDRSMFVRRRIRNAQQASIPDQLEPLEFELPRYMKHVHCWAVSGFAAKVERTEDPACYSWRGHRLTISGGLRAS